MAHPTLAPEPSPSLTRNGQELLLRRFKPGDEEAFRALNEQWIAKYFRIEDKDRETLSDPVGKIIDHGGHIFFAQSGGKKIGTCALIALEPVTYEVARLTPGAYEVAKMAVDESYRGAGIGRAVLEYAVAEAAKLGANRLYLETNNRLTNAIHLYETVGFRHLDPSRVKPSPYNRANVFMEMIL
jgi:putative acetyltransferase